MHVAFFPSCEELLEARQLVHKRVCDELGTKFPQIALLDLWQENELRIYYESKMIDVCNHFRFPNDVLLASALLHKRYYLKSSLLSERDPKHIMLCCIFLGCKLANIRMEISQLTNSIPDSNSQLVLAYEFYVLTDMGFDIQIPPFFSAIEGFLLFGKNYGIQIEPLNPIIRQRFLSIVICSDVLLIFPYAYVALALILETIKQEQTDKYELYFERIESTISMFKPELVHSIIKFIHEFKLPDQTMLKEIDRKRKEIVAIAYPDT